MNFHKWLDHTSSCWSEIRTSRCCDSPPSTSSHSVFSDDNLVSNWSSVDQQRFVCFCFHKGWNWSKFFSVSPLKQPRASLYPASGRHSSARCCLMPAAIHYYLIQEMLHSHLHCRCYLLSCFFFQFPPTSLLSAQRRRVFRGSLKWRESPQIKKCPDMLQVSDSHCFPRLVSKKKGEEEVVRHLWEVSECL